MVIYALFTLSKPTLLCQLRWNLVIQKPNSTFYPFIGYSWKTGTLP